MNPHQKNKVDISAMSTDEQRLFRMYGKLPNKRDLLQNKLKERKYFDSGDYALSKAGKAADTGVTSVGTEHPSAENIPHASPLTNQISRSDSLSTTSPPSNSTLSPQNSSASGQIPTLNSLDMQSSNNGLGDVPALSPGPAGIHRGSLNGMPGANMPAIQNARSPAKESYLSRSESVDDPETAEDQAEQARQNAEQEGRSIPIRRS